jgi:flagellar assembly protein FliH
MIMSEAFIPALPLTAIAGHRSAFKPLRALRVRPAAPEETADEYARGLVDGQQMAATAFEVETGALRNLLASTQALKPEAGPELSLLLRETVLGLVQQISDTIKIDTAFIEAQIARAVAVITEADEARQIILHPDDAALVGNQINALAVRSDPDQPRGMVRIDCSQGWVDHGVALGIERLRELLEQPS